MDYYPCETYGHFVASHFRIEHPEHLQTLWAVAVSNKMAYGKIWQRMESMRLGRQITRYPPEISQVPTELC